MKLFSEKLCEIYSNKIKKMVTIIVRPSNLYGTFDKFDSKKSKVIPALIKKVVKAKSFSCLGKWKRFKRFSFY